MQKEKKTFIKLLMIMRQEHVQMTWKTWLLLTLLPALPPSPSPAGQDCKQVLEDKHFFATNTPLILMLEEHDTVTANKG